MEIFEYIRIFEYIWIFEYIRIFFLQYEYICIHIRIKIALTNIFVFVFGPEKNIRSSLVQYCPILSTVTQYCPLLLHFKYGSLANSAFLVVTMLGTKRNPSKLAPYLAVVIRIAKGRPNCFEVAFSLLLFFLSCVVDISIPGHMSLRSIC